MLSVYHNIYDKTMLFCLHLFLLLAEEAKSDTNIRSFCSMLQGNYSSSTHSCFKYVGGSYSWDKAYSKCRREARRRGIRKGRLAVIPSSRVFDIVKKLALSRPYAWGEHYYGWIGLKPKGSSYEHSKEAYRHGSYSPYKHQWAFYEGYKRVAPFSYVPQSVQVDLPSGVCMQFSYTAVGYDDYTCKDVLGGAVCEFLHPIDCRWAQWNQWSECSVSCGQGTQSRTRQVSVFAQDGGQQCIRPRSQSQTCTGKPCPVDCVWGKRSPWSACSVTCGNGTKTATRDNAVVAQHGGRPCVGEKILSESCYPVNTVGQTVQFCPVDCVWGNWSPWSVCSVTCGNGTKTATRDHAVVAQHGGKACAEEKTLSVSCYPAIALGQTMPSCPVDCVWANWEQWSKCSVTCGNGTMIRKRNESVAVQHNGKHCSGPTNETGFCHGVNASGVTLHLCPIDCVWSNWNPWSPCSLTCGDGIKIRERNEAVSAQYGGKSCSGQHTESEFCHGVSATGVTMKFCPTGQKSTTAKTETTTSEEVSVTLSTSVTAGHLSSTFSKAVVTSPTKTITTSATSPINTKTTPVFPLSETEVVVATVMQSLGCTFILVSLSVTIAAFLFLWDFSYERFIHMNMEIALLIGYIFVLAMRDRTGSPVLCKIAGIGFQFFFLASFSFMMLEALQAYAIATNVISFGGYCSRLQYFVVGWSIPGIITIISAAVKYEDYMSLWSCWLNLDSPLSYSSVFPILILSAVTIIMAEAAGIDNYPDLPNKNKHQATAAKANVKALFIIAPISAFSWFLGAFAVYYQNIALFSVVHAMNIALGISIFVFHSLGNPKVHALFKKFLSRFH